MAWIALSSTITQLEVGVFLAECLLFLTLLLLLFFFFKSLVAHSFASCRPIFRRNGILLSFLSFFTEKSTVLQVIHSDRRMTLLFFRHHHIMSLSDWFMIELELIYTDTTIAWRAIAALVRRRHGRHQALVMERWRVFYTISCPVGHRGAGRKSQFTTAVRRIHRRRQRKDASSEAHGDRRQPQQPQLVTVALPARTLTAALLQVCNFTH